MKHLLTIDRLSKDEITAILDKAETFIQPDGRITAPEPVLAGKTVANLFFEPSTRTRTTFELAAKKLGALVVNLDIETSSAKKRESIKDTFLTMLAMQCDILVIRHPEAGTAEYLAELTDGVSVINAGDGAHAHPTQALLDLLTIRRNKGDFSKLSVAIVGDVLHSRVARSQLAALKRMGVPDIRIVAPSYLLPEDAEQMGATLYDDLNQGIKDVDVIITLRLQYERMQQGLIKSEQEYFQQYGIKEETLKLAKPDAIVMHPGPINREVEIASEVADGAQSLILQQVSNGLAVRMAVITTLVK
jgi:aspartate carbamoyltransferase catalytic subunit